MLEFWLKKYDSVVEKFIITESKDLIYETSEILKVDKILKADMINRLIRLKYSHLLEMKQCFE